jgi:hypothetical protein
MFELKEYSRKLLVVRESSPMSLWELAHDVGISFNTLKRIIDEPDGRGFSYSTLKKLQLFIDKYEETHGRKL